MSVTYLHPDREYNITELAQHADAAVQTVAHEVSRLVKAGLLTDRRVGTARLVRSVQDSLLTRPLTDLLAVTYGPLPVLTEALSDVPGVEEAFVYGSWAARYSGEPGPVPGDVDVLVIGDVDADELDDRARAAEVLLRREVNIRRVRRASWEADADTFLTTIRSRPLVALKTNAAHASAEENS